MGLLRTIGNVVWLVLAGIWLALGYALAGSLLCITIIGIPFGIQAFKLSVLALRPFGRTIVPAGAAPAEGMVVYAVPADPSPS
jgi:uncharacterized membrane protein YccF (DUF307 family)